MEKAQSGGARVVYDEARGQTNYKAGLNSRPEAFFFLIQIASDSHPKQATLLKPFFVWFIHSTNLHHVSLQLQLLPRRVQLLLLL